MLHFRRKYQSKETATGNKKRKPTTATIHVFLLFQEPAFFALSVGIGVFLELVVVVVVVGFSVDG